jgi:ParB/RepB/Spo0J family partition protein
MPGKGPALCHMFQVRAGAAVCMVGAMSLVSVNPLRCRVWSLHPRLEEHLTEESCRAEIESFEKHGQQIAALGRRLRGAHDYDVELIYGARRLFVARHLNVPLLVELRDISDRDGIVAMDIENRHRADVTAYERALAYDRWLRERHFKSQRELANALQISSAHVSRLLQLARLPAQVRDAFSKPADICEAWGERLTTLLADPRTQQRLLAAADEITAVQPRPPAPEIFQRLCAACKARRCARPTQRVVRDEGGDELFRVRQQRGVVVFSILRDLLSQDLLAEIERTLASVLDTDAQSDSRTELRKSLNREETCLQ